MGSVTEQSEHLSSAQIENYGNRTSGAGPETAQREEHQRLDHQSSDGQIANDQRVIDQTVSDQRVEAHLADCPSCRNRLLDFHRHRFALLSGPAPDAKPTDSALADSKFANPKYPAGPQVRTASTPECPSDDALRQLAAGLTPDALATKLTQHAATCNHCGPLLRTYTEIFSDDFSPEEQAALANLQSSSAGWQKTTARRMLEAAAGSTIEPSPTGANAAEADGSRTTAADKPDEKPPAGRKISTAPDRKPFFWKWALVPASAAVVASTVLICGVVGFGVWYARRDTPEKVEALLAQASTEQRNLEIRIPYAKYSEFHQKRSGDPTPLLQLPESSRKAADAISSHLKTHPDDPEWLLLSARWYLLDWQFKPAIEALEKIENKDPSRQSEIDMVRAMALYEKAAYDPNEYGRAIDLLGTVLQKNPNDPIALYNQAVACEKAQNYVCAIDDWNRLLKIENDPGWSGEAQKHLNQIQEKKSPVFAPSPK